MRIMVLGLIAFLLTACQQREDDRETRLETAERQVATVDLDAEEQAVSWLVEQYPHLVRRNENRKSPYAEIQLKAVA